jgi:glyoxylase-like metal-dependent hydrolase (beta-lactamase superfamily II)
MNTSLKAFVALFLAENKDLITEDGFFTGDFDNDSLEPSKYNSDEQNEQLAKVKKDLADKNITIELVDRHGGEGEGEDYWSVYKFVSPDEEVYVKFDGSYTSYDGSEFDEWFFVKAVPVQAFDFRRIK